MEQQEPQLIEQKRTTAASVAVVAIVVVAVVALVVAIVVLRGGGGIGSIPVYAGAVENAESEAQTKTALENMGITGVEIGVYTSTQDATTIASWYRSEMSELGWEKENEITQSGDTIFVFKQGNDGAFILVDNRPGKTDLIICYGQFGSIQLILQSSHVTTVTPPPSLPTICDVDVMFKDNDTWTTTYNPGRGVGIADDSTVYIRIVAAAGSKIYSPTTDLTCTFAFTYNNLSIGGSYAVNGTVRFPQTAVTASNCSASSLLASTSAEGYFETGNTWLLKIVPTGAWSCAVTENTSITITVTAGSSTAYSGITSYWTRITTPLG